MSPETKAKVLVVGSGPAGLILALSLLKNDIPVHIIEKDSAHHEGERGCGIMPRSLEVEYFLGVANEIIEAGQVSKFKIHFMDPEDPRRIRSSQEKVEQVPPAPNMPISTGVMLGQFLHQAILCRHIEAFGGKVELGSALVGFEQDESDPSKPVVVTISKTVNGDTREEKAEFDYVVGADGARSTVRKCMGVDFVGETKEDVKVLLVDAVVHGLGPERGFFRFGENFKKSVSFRTTTQHEKYQIIFTDPDISHEEVVSLPKEENFKKIQEIIETSTGRSDLKLEKIVWQGMWRPNMRIASSFKKGRVFIVGDAAHIHSPTGGQGMNSSIQDSFNLAWKLSLVLKGLAHTSLLDTFNLERQPVIAEMLNITTDLYNKSFGPAVSSAITSAAKNDQDDLKLTGQFRDKRLFMMNVNYRWSDIVLDERVPDKDSGTNAYGISGEAVRAGDRAPDAPALKLISSRQPSTVSRLFDVFNPTLHTAVVFAADPSKARPLLDALKAFPTKTLQTALILPSNAPSPASSVEDADFVFVDTEKHAGFGYSVDKSKPSAVIVRPDGVVGAFALSSEVVQKYVDALFVDV